MTYEHHSLKPQTGKAQIALEMLWAAPFRYHLCTVVVHILVFLFDRVLVMV